MINAFILCGWVALGLCFTGCQSSKLPPPDYSAKVANPNPNIAAEDTFYQAFSVSPIRTGVTNDGYTRVTIDIRNVAAQPCKVIWCFQWFDENGSEIKVEDAGGWHTKYLGAGEETTVSGCSFSKKMASYKIQLKRGY